MTKSSPDHSLIRDGVALCDWLRRLLDEQPQTRLAAGEALQAMEMGIPSVHTDWADFEPMPDIATQRRKFEQAVRVAVGGEGFDTADFVRRLIAYLLALKGHWSRRVEQLSEQTAKRDEKFGRIAARIKTKSGSDAPADEKDRAQKRLDRLIRVYCGGATNCDKDPCEGAESLSPPAIVAHRIFDILNTELLAAPDALHLMLDEKQLRHYALAALARIGPPAAAFVPRLIDEIERLPERKDTAWPYFDGAEALGAIGRSNAGVVEAIIRLLGTESSSRRVAAAATAEHLGAEVCGREEELISLLEPMIARDDEYGAAFPAMASVGRHFARVRARVVGMAEARPPKWRTAQWPEGTEEKYDETMFERGAAINAMQFFADYPDECIPVLVRAMDTFEEYDPDEEYGGPQGRISFVLGRFGPKAAAAAVPLASHLLDEPDELPTSILEALAEIGPAAVEVLPDLYALREKDACDESWDDLDTVLVERFCDPVGWAIQRIRGQQ